MIIPIPYDEFRVWKQLIAPKLTGLNDIAEEMFRVWQSFHKETVVKYRSAGDKVKKIISRVTQ